MSFSIHTFFRRGQPAIPGPSDDRVLAQKLVDRGIAAETCGSLAEALQCYRRAVEVGPRFGLAHMNLGVALQATAHLPLLEFMHSDRFTQVPPLAALSFGTQKHFSELVLEIGVRAQ
jgi:hypothetical protein